MWSMYLPCPLLIALSIPCICGIVGFPLASTILSLLIALSFYFTLHLEIQRFLKILAGFVYVNE